MALTRLPGFTLLATDSYTFGNANVTGNIAAGNLKTDHLLYANGSPYVFTTSASGSNTQVQFNDGGSFAGSANFTFNKTTNTLSVTNLATTGTSGNISGANNITANFFIGNGASLSAIAGANVTGFVPNANVANTAYSVAAANVTGLGNIATINKDGNASNILYGNGVFAGAPVTYGNANVATFLASFGSNSISTTGNASVGNLVVGGNLTVNGTLTSINSTIVEIDDLAIVLANDASTSTQANGAGIIINGASANMLYVSTSNAFVFSHKISADGGLLSNITGGNVTGQVGYAAVANSVAVANVSGIGNIATINKDGNASNILYGNGSFAAAPVTYGNSNVATFLASFGSNSISTTGNITAGNLTTSGSSGNISGANNITANFFIGNGASLSAIAGANVTGQVGYAAVANSVAVANVSGIGNIATINKDGNTSNILYGNGVFAAAPSSTYGNSNVSTLLASFGSNSISTTGNITVGNITVSTSANLGSNANVKITGGTTGQVLSTDGSGALSWVTPSTSGTAIGVDTFTGDGTTTSFTLSSSPSSVNNVIVNYNGAFVGRSSYSVSGTTLTFGSAPANGSKIEVSTISGLGTGSATFNTRTATGDGTTTAYTVTSGITANTVLATIDGVLQTPTSDYTVSGTTLTFISAPYNGAAIQLRELGVASLGSVAVANVIGIGNIATINKDGNTSNILYGNGVFAAVPASYANANVVTLLTSFGSNTISTTGNITAGNLSTGGSGGNISGANNVTANFFIGNGQALTGLAGANVTGQVGYAAVANSVAVANVSGIGNIATINKDGNASNILYGNGSFAAAPVGYSNSNVATFLASYGSNTITTTGNISVGNIAGNVGGYPIGYKNVPPVGTKTASYTLATTDVGKYVQIGTSGAITIPNSTFSEGDIVSLFNNTSGGITITCSITSAYIAGTDAVKSTMTLATRGVATIFFISGTVCVVSGSVS